MKRLANDGQRKILIADYGTAPVILNHILSSEYSVVTVKSGDAALRRMAVTVPDLLLLSASLPDMSGFDLLARMKETPAMRDIPVLLVLDESKADSAAKGIALGAADYVSAPFSDAVVKARIRTHIQLAGQKLEIEKLKKLEKNALVDSLTYISNLKHFRAHLEAEWRRALQEKRPISFLKLDVDRLTEFNEANGHSNGDELLKTVAQISASAARRPSDMAARLDGEAFGVLLPDTSLDYAMIVAEQIRAAVASARIATAGGYVADAATVSIGAASLVPADGETTLDFIAKANENLGAAKSSGMNKVVGTDALRSAYGLSAGV